MMTGQTSGFIELEHTADWALKVWAPDLSELFALSAQGMYWLMETRLQDGPRVERFIAHEAEDVEILLVSFLSDLLYLGESEGLGFDDFQVTITGQRLAAVVRGAPTAEQKKEIKAVTYHNLFVQRTEQGLTVTIVFDV